MNTDDELMLIEEEVVDHELSEYLTKIRVDLDCALGRINQLESAAALELAERDLERQVHALGAPYHTCHVRILAGGKVVISTFHDGSPPKATTVEKLRSHLSKRGIV
jgi:hypothetical protein